MVKTTMLQNNIVSHWQWKNEDAGKSSLGHKWLCPQNLKASKKYEHILQFALQYDIHTYDKLSDSYLPVWCRIPFVFNAKHVCSRKMGTL